MTWPRMLESALAELLALQLEGELQGDAHYQPLRWLGRHPEFLHAVRAERLPAERNPRRRQAITRVLMRAENAAAEPADSVQETVDDIADARAEIADIRLGLVLGPWWSDNADAA